MGFFSLVDTGENADDKAVRQTTEAMSTEENGESGTWNTVLVSRETLTAKTFVS